MVNEDRLYLSWPSNNSKLASKAFVPHNSGILSAKRAINELHNRLGQQGYSQVSESFEQCSQVQSGGEK